jgi:microcystin-dependent protein
MGNCSNISNTQTVTLDHGTLTSGFCHNTLQATYEEFIDRTTGSLGGNMAAFTAGDDTPASGDQNKLWMKQNASTCVPEGWHWYNGSSSAWERVITGSETPTGSVSAYAGSSSPDGWLLCDGSAISRTTYDTLYGIIGTTYGTTDSTDFKVPDMRGRVVAGQDDMGGTSANRLTNPATTTGGIDGDVLGGTGGSETHQLTIAELAAHTHHGEHNIANSTAANGGGYAGQGGNSASSSTGGDDPHNNVQPTLILNYIIKI